MTVHLCYLYLFGEETVTYCKTKTRSSIYVPLTERVDVNFSNRVLFNSLQDRVSYK